MNLYVSLMDVTWLLILRMNSRRPHREGWRCHLIAGL